MRAAGSGGRGRAGGGRARGRSAPPRGGALAAGGDRARGLEEMHTSLGPAPPRRAERDPARVAQEGIRRDRAERQPLVQEIVQLQGEAGAGQRNRAKRTAAPQEYAARARGGGGECHVAVRVDARIAEDVQEGKG